MSNAWLRLWHDMPNDPKWRTIARVSGQRIGDVIAVFVHILTNASANAPERGRTQSISAEDLGSALDMDSADVEAILTAMQGRVLEGDRVRGWEKRQPEREDGSAERAKRWREAKKAETNAPATIPNASERKRTQANAEERPDTDTEEIRERERAGAESKALAPSAPEKQAPADRLQKGTRLPTDWQPSPEDLAFAAKERPDVDARTEAHSFRDFWNSKPGADGRKTDWSATWRNWIRRCRSNGARASPASITDRVRRSAEEFGDYQFSGSGNA